jgi:DNA-binding response OmpR family regulator
MATAQLTGSRVLLIEDDPMIGILVEDMLIEAGCHVCGPFMGAFFQSLMTRRW